MQSYHNLEVVGSGKNGPIVTSLSWILEGYLKYLDTDTFTYVVNEDLRYIRKVLNRCGHPGLLERGVIKKSIGGREVIAETRAKSDPKKVHRLYVGNMPFNSDHDKYRLERWNHMDFSCDCFEFRVNKICTDLDERIVKEVERIRENHNIPISIKVYLHPICPDLHALFMDLSSSIGMWTLFDYHSHKTTEMAATYFDLRHGLEKKYKDVEEKLGTFTNWTKGIYIKKSTA